MGNNLCIWMLCLYIRNIFRLNTLMCRAKSVIINKILLRYLTGNIVSQITVRDKENILLWQFLYNLNCICGSNTNIRILLKCCSRIDVTYYCKDFKSEEDCFNAGYECGLSDGAYGRNRDDKEGSFGIR